MLLCSGKYLILPECVSAVGPLIPSTSIGVRSRFMS